MEDSKDHKVVVPPNPLKAKVISNELQRIDTIAIAKADKAVSDMRQDYLKRAEELVANLSTAMHTLAEKPDDPKRRERVIQFAYALGSEGKTLGYNLISRIGKGLSDYMAEVPVTNDRTLDVIRLHVDSLKVVVGSKL